MVKVAQHISQLLYCHDCVIVPNFGGFVTNYKPANINSEKGIATPPSKTISFNRFLLHNDGLLINEISKQENISYKESQELVKNYVDDCHESLRKNNRLEIDKIGVFFHSDNKLQFNSSSYNFEVKSYGLPEFSFELKKKEETNFEPKPLQRKEETIKENRTVEVVAATKRKRTIPKYAITTLGLIVLFYVAWLPLKTDVLKTGNVELSDLNPFRFDKCPSVYSSAVKKIAFESYSEKEDKNDSVIDIEGRNFVVVDFNNEEAIPESTFVETSVSKETVSLSKMYYVIAGCFKEYANALGLVADLKSKGYQAEIIDQHKGLYRVAISKFANKEDAMNLYFEFRQIEDSTVWVLRK